MMLHDAIHLGSTSILHDFQKVVSPKWSMKHIYSKSYMVFQFTLRHLTLGGIERSTQGHWVVMCIIDNVLLYNGAVRPKGLLFEKMV